MKLFHLLVFNKLKCVPKQNFLIESLQICKGVVIQGAYLVLVSFQILDNVIAEER